MPVTLQQLSQREKRIQAGTQRRRYHKVMISTIFLASRSRNMTLALSSPTKFLTTKQNHLWQRNRRQAHRSASSFSQKSQSSLSSLSNENLTFNENESSSFQQHQNALYLPSDPDFLFPIRTVAAPMVAASDFAFRCLCRQHGVDLAFTQMLHARKVTQDRKFCQNHFDFFECYNDEGQSDRRIPPRETLLPGQAAFIEDDDDSKRQWQAGSTSILPKYTTAPLIVQLAGNEPSMVLKAAKIVMEDTNGKVSGFDLNCGCPQGIARKGNYGAFLMEQDEQAVFSVLTALRQELPDHISVSAKIRLPVNPDHLPSRIKSLVDTGIDFCTIHGRNLHENKTKVRESHSDQIKRAIEIAQTRRQKMPIIANGGVETYSDVAKVLSETNAIAIMSSEALLETPNVFSFDSAALRQTPRELLEQQFQFARDYLQWCRLYPPHPGVVGYSMNIVRGHLFKFLYRYLQDNIVMRDELARNWKIQTVNHAEDFVDRLYDKYKTADDESLLPISQADQSWYRRHWEGKDRIHQKEFGGGTSTDAQDANYSLSVEERKIILKKRIVTLQKQRQSKEEKVGLSL